MAAAKLLRHWEVDDATVVQAKIGDGRKITISVNETRIPGQLTLSKGQTLGFDLTGDRRGAVTVSRQFGSQPAIDLRVNGLLMLETGKTPIYCPSCRAKVRPNDRFCEYCGAALKSAEHHKHKKQIKGAANTIWAIAALFAVSGVISFFVQKSTADKALQRLAGLPDAMTYPQAVNGAHYTVAALRHQLGWEVANVLIVNLILAAVMAGLALWSKRAPLAAVLAATATYAVVIVTNAMISPASIVQGVYVKLLVILALARGIKSAFALRAETT